MPPLCAIFQEGTASIPVRSSVTVQLRFAPNGNSGIIVLRKDFATAPLLRYSKLARRTIIDGDENAFTVDCRGTSVHPEYYDQVLQFLANRCFQWRPANSKIEAPKILQGNITCLNDAIGTWAALLTFDLVKSIRQNWVRLWIIRHIEQKILTPAELHFLWNVLRNADQNLVRYAIESVAESWNRDSLGTTEFSCLTFIAEKVPELWKRLDQIMGDYKLNPDIRHLMSLLLPDDDPRLQMQDELGTDNVECAHAEDNGEEIISVEDRIDFEDSDESAEGYIEVVMDIESDGTCLDSLH
jgi:hypothetical protein